MAPLIVAQAGIGIARKDVLQDEHVAQRSLHQYVCLADAAFIDLDVAVPDGVAVDVVEAVSELAFVARSAIPILVPDLPALRTI